LETIDTLIIGAGPAGLTAAYTLAKAGHGVLVIERDRNYVGGISRAVSNKGFLIDIGGHRFVSKSREVVALWNEILPGDFLVHPRLSRIYCAGKFYAYPLRAFEVLRNLGVARSIACLASYAYARAFPVRDPKTFHQWMRAQIPRFYHRRPDKPDATRMAGHLDRYPRSKGQGQPGAELPLLVAGDGPRRNFDMPWA
jgi:protoporphyrinogen oxidase